MATQCRPVPNARDASVRAAQSDKHQERVSYPRDLASRIRPTLLRLERVVSTAKLNPRLR
jgi:hypothetical protein